MNLSDVNIVWLLKRKRPGNGEGEKAVIKGRVIINAD